MADVPVDTALAEAQRIAAERVAGYAKRSLDWRHGEKTEDELLQRIWNLANDVIALAAALASVPSRSPDALTEALALNATLAAEVDTWHERADRGWERAEVGEAALALACDLIAYSRLRDKVRNRSDPTEFVDAERLIRRFDLLTERLGSYGRDKPAALAGSSATNENEREQSAGNGDERA